MNIKRNKWPINILVNHTFNIQMKIYWVMTNSNDTTSQLIHQTPTNYRLSFYFTLKNIGKISVIFCLYRYPSTEGADTCRYRNRYFGVALCRLFVNAITRPLSLYIGTFLEQKTLQGDLRKIESSTWDLLQSEPRKGFSKVYSAVKNSKRLLILLLNCEER